MCSVNRRLSTSKQRAETLPERSLTHRAGVIWECETLWTHPALNSQHTHHRVFPLLLSPHQAPPITFLEWNKRCQVASSCNSSVCVKASKIFEGLRIVRFIYKRNKQINKQTRDSFTRTILVASLVFYLENVFNIEISSFSLSGSPVWAVASLFLSHMDTKCHFGHACRAAIVYPGLVFRPLTRNCRFIVYLNWLLQRWDIKKPCMEYRSALWAPGSSYSIQQQFHSDGWDLRSSKWKTEFVFMQMHFWLLQTNESKIVPLIKRYK